MVRQRECRKPFPWHSGEIDSQCFNLHQGLNYAFSLCNWPIGKVFPDTMYKLQQGLHFINYFVNLALKTQINKYLNYSIVKFEHKLVTQVSWFFLGFANKENAKTSPFPKPIGIWKLSHWYFSKISLHLLAIVTLLHFFLPLSIIVINWKIASFRESWFIFFPKIASLLLLSGLYGGRLLVTALAFYHKLFL